MTIRLDFEDVFVTHSWRFDDIDRGDRMICAKAGRADAPLAAASPSSRYGL